MGESQGLTDEDFIIEEFNDSLLVMTLVRSMNATPVVTICNYTPSGVNVAFAKPYRAIGHTDETVRRTHGKINDGISGSGGKDYARFLNGSGIIIDIGDTVVLNKIIITYHEESTRIERILVSMNGVDFSSIGNDTVLDITRIKNMWGQTINLKGTYSFDPEKRARYIMVGPIPDNSSWLGQSLITEIEVYGYDETCVSEVKLINTSQSLGLPCSRDYENENYKKVFGSCTLSNRLGAHCVAQGVGGHP